MARSRPSNEPPYEAVLYSFLHTKPTKANPLGNRPISIKSLGLLQAWTASSIILMRGVAQRKVAVKLLNEHDKIRAALMASLTEKAPGPTKGG